MQGWIEVGVNERRLTLQFNRSDEASRLDGCYVIKTDLPVGDISAGMIHDRYKDLAQVEWAFRTFKQGHLDIHPPLSRQRPALRDMFCDHAGLPLERELYRCWQNLDITVAEGIDELGSLRVWTSRSAMSRAKVPRPVGLSEKLLQAAGVRLPNVLP